MDGVGIFLLSVHVVEYTASVQIVREPERGDKRWALTTQQNHAWRPMHTGPHSSQRFDEMFSATLGAKPHSLSTNQTKP